MLRRTLLVALGLAALTWTLAGRAQAPQQGKAGAGLDEKADKIKRDLALREQILANRFSEFRQSLLKLKQRLEASPKQEDRERAVILQKALDKAEATEIGSQFDKIVETIKGRDLKTLPDIQAAMERSNKLAEDLRQILDLLREDNRASKLREERARLEELVKRIEKIIAEERNLRAKTERMNQDQSTRRDLARAQADIRQKTEDVARKMGGGKGAEAKKGDAKPAGKGGDKAGESKNQGKKSGQSGEAKDQGKKGEGKPGEAKGDKSGAPKEGGAKSGDKSGQGKEGSAKSGKGSPSEAKSGDKSGQGKEGQAKEGDKNAKGNEGQAKPDEKGSSLREKEKKAEAKENKGGEGKQGDAKSSQRGGEGKASQPKGGQKGGENKPGESKSGSKSSGQGASKSDGSKSGQPSPGGNPGDSKGDNQKKPSGDPNQNNPGNAKKNVQQAAQHQQQAEKKINEGKKKDASDDEGKSIDELEKAKKKLEELLNQIREEELEKLLAALQARCQRMLEMQIRVLAGTERVDKGIQGTKDKKADRVHIQDSLKLSDDEKEIVGEATRAIEMLEAEGSAVAFPEVFQQVRSDMIVVQKRLGGTDVGKVTQAIERDIIDTLKEMIEALKKARQDLDNKKSPPSSGQPPPNQDQKLLDQIAELKMIRSMQVRVNGRTQMYGKQYQDIEGEQTRNPELRRELQILSERQERIFDVTNRIARGDNK
jgi:hypothetical protein